MADLERVMVILGMQEEDKAPEQRRTLQQFKNDPVILSFALAPEQDAELAPSQQPAVRQRGKSLLGGVGGNRLVEGLPKNVHLLTLMALKDGDVLLRLAHLYQVSPSVLLFRMVSTLFSSCMWLFGFHSVLLHAALDSFSRPH